MAFKQEVNIPMVLATGLISVMILVVLILGTQAWFQNSEEAEYDLKASDAGKSEFVQLKQKQAESLERMGWTNNNKNAVMIPIGQAMEMVVKTNGKLPTTQPG